MGTRNLTMLYQETMIELPMCPRPFVLQNVRQIITDFCHETQAWTYDLDAINVVTGVQEYDLDSLKPSYAEIDCVVTVVQDDLLLYPLEDFKISSRDPYTLYLIDNPTSDGTGSLEVQVALRPALTATLIDARFYDDWHQTWAYGVMGKLMTMPEKAWTNLAQAKFYTRKYYDGIILAKAQQNSGGTNARLQANAPAAFRW